MSLKSALPLAFLGLLLLPLGCSGSKTTSGGTGGMASGGQSEGGSSGSSSTAAGGTTAGKTGGTATGGWSATGGTGEGGSGGNTETSPEDAAVASSEPVDASIDEKPSNGCADQLINGEETDIDCGGSICPKCWPGKVCLQDSDCRSGTCSAGKCLDPFVPNAKITTDGYLWKIAVGSTELSVQPNGGKVSAFTLGGTNALVINDAATGAITWIAPQSDWSETGWPPPPELDENATYKASSKDNVLTMVGPTGTDGLSITKRFWGNVEHEVVTLEYTIKNSGKTAVKKAAWEISRHYPGGLTFFPTEEEPVAVPGPNVYAAFELLPLTTGAGAAWFKYQKANWTKDSKAGANGTEGWTAHINCGAGLEKTCASGAKSIVMIKDWMDSLSEAPGEKEIEIFANAGHNYIEIEQQSEYQSIPAGGTLVWTMHWLLRTLPSDIAPKPGNAALVNWVRSQIL